MFRTKASKCNKQQGKIIKKAIDCVLAGESLYKASQKTGLSTYTIKKYYTKYKADLELIKTGNLPSSGDESENQADTVFTSGQLNYIIECFRYFKSMFFGVSEKECRILAYQMAIKENLKVPDNWKRGMASVEWLQLLKSRRPDLYLERPDRCSGFTTRSIACEKKNVSKFFDDYEGLIQINPVFQNSSRIFSLDETYTSINPRNKTVNIESKHCIITTCVIVSADGTSLPPVIVKPNKTTENYTDYETSSRPLILVDALGRLTSDVFVEVMKHFVNYSNSSLNNPSLLIMDIDICHLSLSAFSLAKTAGVHVLTIHPHSTKKLQPLAVGLFDLFHTYYYAELDSKFKEWQQSFGSFPEITCQTLFDWLKYIEPIVEQAYTKAMTPENVRDAFKKCGILPFDRDLFTDNDYQSCVVVDQPCIVCRARDDRCRRKSVSEEPAAVTDENSSESTKDSELEPLENAAEKAADNVDSSRTPKVNPTPRSVRPEMSPKERGAELDKLKRRMIRTVARLLKEKKTEEEVFEELKKESGSNCRNLWERMRSLTMKKLKRLLDADDRVDHVPAVARMSLTDWLLYDLVIVHEKIDVIERNAPTSKVLNNLFSLIQMFSIEGRSGDDLAEAWTAATVYYNSKGHQCSPMLMQRRWYQIKELTRHKMYKFWFNYRGNQRLLDTAKQDPPTELQKAIALRYPDIITAPFPEWEDRIEAKLVIMPEEFEVKMRKKSLMKPSDDTADVVIVEKQIDTICLEDTDSENSDEENSGESTGTSSINAIENSSVNVNNDETSQTPIIVQVKTEPQDSYENIDITDTNYQPQSGEPYDRFQDEIERLKMQEDKILTDEEDTEFGVEEAQNSGLDVMMPLITNIKGGIDTRVENENQDDASVSDTEHEDIENDLNEAVDVENEETTQKNVSFSDKNIESIENNLDGVIEIEKEKATQNEISFGDNLNAPLQESILIDDDDSDDEMIPLKDLAKKRTVNVTNPNENETIDITSREINTTTNEQLDRNYDNTIENSNSEAILENAVFDEPTVEEDVTRTNEISSDSHVETKQEIDNEILLEDSEESENEAMPLARQCLAGILGKEEIHNMEPDIQQSNNPYVSDEILSDINFADDGIEFADDGIEYNEDNEDRNGSATHGNFGSGNESEGNCNPKFDLKLLMTPIVYTTKLDEMTVYKEIPLFDTIEEKNLIDKIIFESKPISAKPVHTALVKVENLDTDDIDDDIVLDDTSDESDDDFITESKKVKMSSNLLQKPRSRSYHPIQLCKNPDFNTRLKRLTVGFFTSTRNRVLLKSCKPMTIDLSKAFESKLLNGTMYLKPSDPTVKIEENTTESTVSVMPSAVAVQSLMDNTDVDKILQEELKKRMLERNKNISLPNISIVRQINQHLLMAEVAPIMAQIEKTALTDYANNCQENVITDEKEKAIPFDNGPKSLKLNPDAVMSAQSIDSHSQTNIPAARDDCPFNVDTYTNTFETKDFTNEKPINIEKQSQLVAETNQSKIDKALEKQKKIKERQKNMNMPSWIVKNSEPKSCSDLLLTIDTLYKMLNALDPCKEYASKLNKPKHKPKNSGSSIQTVPDSQPKNSGSSIQTVPDSKMKNLGTAIQAVTDSAIGKVALPRGIVSPKIRMVNVSSLRKVSSSQPKRKRRNCCWAKSKIEKLSLKCNFDQNKLRMSKHKCPAENCRCCCKELLRQLEIDMDVKILENMQSSSVDVDLTKAIENVMEQTRDLPEVIEKPAVHIVNVDQNSTFKHAPQMKINIDVGLQADLDEYDKDTEPDKNQAQLHGEPVDAQVTIDVDEEDDNVPPLSKIRLSPKPLIRVYSGNTKNVVSTAPQLRDQIKTTRVTKQTPVISAIRPKIKPKQVDNAISLQSKYKLYSQEPEEISEPVCAPCSCKTIIKDQTLSTLLVDGSSDCPRHGKSCVSKETRIYLNRKHMSLTERPFYVGKNKILLTNVKQPKASHDPMQITLPDGVQVVLLPDGTITYLLEPNVELTPQQKEAMPAILNAIMLQIKASGITLPVPITNLQETGETINLEDNPKPIVTTDVQNLENSKRVDGENQKYSYSSNKELNSTAPHTSVENLEKESTAANRVVDQQSLQNVAFQEPSPDAANIISEVAKVTTEGEEQTLSVCESQVQVNNEEVIDKDTQVIDKSTFPTAPGVNVNEGSITGNEHNYASPEKNDTVASTGSVVSNSVAASSSRNLLSDLMEMSGIVEEDIAPVPQQQTTTYSIVEPAINPSDSLIPELSSKQLGLIPVPGLSPFGTRKHSISAQIDEKVHELNPITSFAELKYACDHDGLFFKLDLSSGVIVPINVCIQKTTSESAGVKANLNSTAIIDLTDEEGVSINEQAMMIARLPSHHQAKVRNTSKIMPRKLSTMMPVASSHEKSILKVTHQPYKTTQPKTSEQKKKELLSRLSNNLKPLRILQKQQECHMGIRKSRLNKVEARIDLIDSDAPMEEEYLVQDSSDSSDDEPLAKKAKKLRQDDKEHSQELAHGSKNVQESQVPMALQTDEIIDFEEAIDAIESVSQLLPSVSQIHPMVSQIHPTVSQIHPTVSQIHPPVNQIHPTVSDNAVPVPTQLVLTGGALNQPILLNEAFLSENDAEDEDSQEDCILGV